MRGAAKVALALLLLATPAVAQTPPNWTYGQVPTTEQWNAIFASKQDYLGAPPLLTTGGSMTGKLSTAASVTARAGLGILPGVAPTSPIDGDVWTTSGGLFVRINGTTIGPLSGGSGASFNGLAPISVAFPAGVVTYSIANGTSVLNPGTGTLEALLPIQTTTGASKTFATADLFKETRRSNSGSAMTDTFPASSATGLVNGTKIVVTNVDATAGDTITPGAGTTIAGGGVVPAGRAVQYVYDLAATTWRPTLNTGTALLGPVTANAVLIGGSPSSSLQYAAPSALQGCLSSTGASSAPSFGSTTFSQCGPVSYVNTISGLKAVQVGTTPNVYVVSYSTPGDGGGGWFYGDPVSVCTDNGGTCIAPNVGLGRWLRNYAGSEINAKWFGIAGNGSTSDQAPVNAARDLAIAAKGSLYLPSVSACYALTSLSIPDLTSGLRIRGDSKSSALAVGNTGSVICANSSSNAIDLTASSGGSIGNITIEDLKVYNGGPGDAIKMTNVNWITLRNMVITATQGTALNVVGTGIFAVYDAEIYGGNNPGVKIGPSLTTNSGPGIFIGGQVSLLGGNATSCVSITGGGLGTVIQGTFLACQGPNMVATVMVDGDGAANQSGVLSLIGIHTESSFNSTTNTGSDVLVGSVNPFGSVSVIDWSGFGQGDGTHYQRDGVRVVAAQNVTVTGSNFTKLAQTNGYSRGAIRLETTFSGQYFFQNNYAANVSGALYSDARGICSGSGACVGGGMTLDVLTLGTPLASTSGGTGFASYAVGDLLWANTTTSLARLNAAAANNVLLSGTTPSWGKVPVAALVSSSTTVNGQVCTLGSTCSISASLIVGSSTITSGTSLGVLYNNAGVLGNTIAGTNGQVFVGVSSGSPLFQTMSGDATITSAAVLTLSSTITAGGPTGSATVAPVITYDAKGRLTAVSSATITPAVGSITGFGSGVATWLATPSSANLAAALTDETGGSGGGVAVFNKSPSFATSIVVTANSGTPAAAAISGTAVQAVGADGAFVRIGADAYGTGIGVSFNARHARGTAASPTATQSGDILGILVNQGYGATGFDSINAFTGFVAFATENHTDAAQGSEIAFTSTPNGTVLNVEGFRLLQSGQHKFTAASNFTANGTTATVLGGLGPAGAHTTVQKWLTVIDNTGATLYVPGF